MTSISWPYFTVQLPCARWNRGAHPLLVIWTVMKFAIILAGVTVVYIGLAAIFLLAMPAPHEPFDYLVAGAFATGIGLMIGFGFYAKATLGRTARRSGRSS